MARRLGYIETMRGVGALIVAASHFPSFYDVTSESFGRSVLEHRTILAPLLLLLDGEGAVCMFFVLSGYVLTLSFARYVSSPTAALSGRFVRLFVPGILSCALGYIVFVCINSGSFSAAQAMIRGDGHGSLGSFIRDAFLNVPWLGYNDSSVLLGVPGLGHLIQTPELSYNEPLWTLSIEWQGSIILFALVALRQRNYKIWCGVLAVGFLLTIRHWYICFLFGHVLAVRDSNGRTMWDRQPWTRRALAGAGLALGVLILVFDAAGMTWPFSILTDATLPLISCDDPGAVARLYASMLIFASVSALPRLRSWLEIPAFRSLGPMSFPIYLTHFPIAILVMPLILAHLADMTGGATAIGVSFFVFACLTFLLARVFLRIDRMAIKRAAQLRDALIELR
jgi:peptidoglycan/LPS O-acetylase OafA/YrhL